MGEKGYFDLKKSIYTYSNSVCETQNHEQVKPMWTKLKLLIENEHFTTD